MAALCGRIPLALRRKLDSQLDLLGNVEVLCKLGAAFATEEHVHRGNRVERTDRKELCSEELSYTVEHHTSPLVEHQQTLALQWTESASVASPVVADQTTAQVGPEHFH